LIHDNKSLPAGVIACDYAPYSAVFPRASAIVHQAGIGTTAEALRAGRPMLVMPCAHDQPDNAARAVRIGVAREIKRHSYNAESAASELAALLSEPSYASCAAAARQHIAAEDGVTSACDAIEEYLSTRGKRAHKGR
jgi:UDP:flavonoid glycosyltransferase YjiC (YdhE family)